jgi:DNA-binding NarL/FixJ family response regulator
MALEILITDDHMLFRQGLRSLLESEGFRVIAEAADGRTAVKLAKQLQPCAAIIDVSMPGLNGIEATKQIRHDSPGVRVIVLSMRSDSRAVLDAFAAGAYAYLLKEAAFEEVVVALRVVLRGKTYLSPAIAHVVVRNSVERWSTPREGGV